MHMLCKEQEVQPYLRFRLGCNIEPVLLYKMAGLNAVQVLVLPSSSAMSQLVTATQPPAVPRVKVRTKCRSFEM